MRYVLAHCPTFLLIVGWPLFWAEMRLHPGAHTSWASWIIAVAVTSIMIIRLSVSDRPSSVARLPRTRTEWLAIATGLGILIVAAAASVLPPHLGQESDVLNYHYSLARQHLIRGTFDHLSWSSVDLWLMPIQHALSPFWFSTDLPNKFPQLLFLLGLLAVAFRITRVRAQSTVAALWVVIAILGSHGFGVQMGSAMLDIAIVYLALAAWDSFTHQQWFLGCVELAFWVWSKPFMPIQALLSACVIGVLLFILQRNGWKVSFGYAVPIKKLALIFAVLSVVIAGPFMWKSFAVSGTLLYPFAPHASFSENARMTRDVRSTYGEERDMGGFLKHFWTIAVPKNGVNNAFDYPAGLPYLLCLIPFLYVAFQKWKNKQWDSFIPLTFVLWALWWGSSQQSRWLYLPFVLMFITVFSYETFQTNRFLQKGILVGLVLNALSVFRAHHADLKTWPHPTLREWDTFLLTQTRGMTSEMSVTSKEIAFAECPTVVTGKDHFYILADPKAKVPF